MTLWISRQWPALKNRGKWYWVRVVLVIIAGVWAGDMIGRSGLWIDQRRRSYAWLLNRLPRKAHPHRTALILIGDNEYWFQELAGRQPIRRDYLAKLISAVAAGDPTIIAVDFDIRSPSPDGNPTEHPAYIDETEELLKTIKQVAVKLPIVLPKTIGRKDGRYATESDIYDRYDFGSAQIFKGYIALPRDERRVPLYPLKLQNGVWIDSFSRAIVRIEDPNRLADSKGEMLPYGGFMNLEAFPRISASEILRGDRNALSKLRHKIVFIGGHWHAAAVDRGGFIDIHDSPVGLMPGVALHANYVEAILDLRLYWGWKPITLHIIEGIGAFLVALIFALEIPPLVKMLTVAVVGVLLVIVSISALLVFGLLFDFFVPVVSVIGHGLIERALEWRSSAMRASNL